MRMSTKSRFAVQAMIDLALRERTGPGALAQIAARQGVSLSYLEIGLETVPINRDARRVTRWAFGVAVRLFCRLALGSRSSGRSFLRRARRAR